LSGASHRRAKLSAWRKPLLSCILARARRLRTTFCGLRLTVHSALLAGAESVLPVALYRITVYSRGRSIIRSNARSGSGRVTARIAPLRLRPSPLRSVPSSLGGHFHTVSRELSGSVREEAYLGGWVAFGERVYSGVYSGVYSLALRGASSSRIRFSAVRAQTGCIQGRAAEEPWFRRSGDLLVSQ
jgi:hypothetical protein